MKIDKKLCEELDKELKARYPTKKDKIKPPIMLDNDPDWIAWVERHKKS
ncbi:MAG: hypothetical protein PHW33_04785 [Candidatus Portnoybacteria bacterium]|nr:hypothetical protein [Candidatus Portnoybacteria bacterium]